MSKQWKPSKPTVELRQSRIRRDPARMDKPEDKAKEVRWRSSEWEIKLAIIGIVAFAIAINIITFGISAYTN